MILFIDMAKVKTSMIHGINNQYDLLFKADIIDKLWSTKKSANINSLNDNYFYLSDFNDKIRFNTKKYIDYLYFAHNLY